jgi:hypothetical protein
MPKVPVYGGPQIERQVPNPTRMQTPDVSSGLQAVARGLGEVSEGFDKIALRDDQTKAFETEAQITQEWLKWDSQARQQFRGANVDGYEAAAQQWWKDSAETYGKDLNPRAKALASRGLMGKQNQALGNVLQFTSTEKERHADEAANANIASTIQFGVTSGEVASAADQVRGLVAAQGVRKRWTTEQVQDATQRNLSNLHVAHLAKLAESNAEAAQTYFTQNRGEISFAQQGKIEEAIKGEADNQFSRKFAADVAAKPLSEQLTEAGKITDPQRRDKALREVKLNHALVKEAEHQAQQKVADTVWTQYVDKGRRVPEILRGAMGEANLRELINFERAHAARVASGAQVKTNPSDLARVYDLMRDDPAEFKKLRMVALTNHIAPNDIEQIARIQRDMLKPDREKDVATSSQLLGTYTGGWKPEKKAAFSSSFYDELDRFEKEKGRPANYKEKREIGDRLMLDGEVMSGKWYVNDPNKKLYETTPDERQRFAPTISTGDRALIVKALQAEGVAQPTDEQINARFKLAKGIK